MKKAWLLSLVFLLFTANTTTYACFVCGNSGHNQNSSQEKIELFLTCNSVEDFTKVIENFDHTKTTAIILKFAELNKIETNDDGYCTVTINNPPFEIPEYLSFIKINDETICYIPNTNDAEVVIYCNTFEQFLANSSYLRNNSPQKKVAFVLNFMEHIKIDQMSDGTYIVGYYAMPENIVYIKKLV